MNLGANTINQHKVNHTEQNKLGRKDIQKKKGKSFNDTELGCKDTKPSGGHNLFIDVLLSFGECLSDVV